MIKSAPLPTTLHYHSNRGMLTLRRFSPFVQIKAGDQQPPIFIAPGLCGTVQFSELAKHIHTRHPIYGLQAKGVDGLEPPQETVEDMASFYLEALEEFHPDEPYLLIGYSFGGLVALEMAQRLSAKGKQIAMLLLLDAFPHPRFMPVPWRVRISAQRATIHARHMLHLSLGKAFSYFREGAKRRFQRARLRAGTGIIPETPSLSIEQATLGRVKDGSYRAYCRYKPGFYQGKITFVATEDKTFFPGDPAAIWSNLAADLEVEAVPGTHLNIVTSKFEPLGVVLTRYIGQATASIARQSQPT